MESNKTYGEFLPDQVDKIAALTDAQLGLLSDLREIYKERAALEKEYSAKLALLAKKAVDKKSKRIASLVVGDDPSVAWGDDTLRRSTLDNAYNQLIASFDNTAQDHNILSDQLTSQVVDATKLLQKKHEDMKNKQYQFYHKVLSDRDQVYAERQKAKQNYDEECLGIDSYRRKQDRSQDEKHANRAAKQYETQVTDMQNSKNAFLVAIAIANSSRSKFYTEDLPLIENDFQRLQTSLLMGLVSILTQAQDLQTSHLKALLNRVEVARSALGQVNPTGDQNLFISCNIRAFSVPNDWEWEPCAGYYDSGEMVVEPQPKVVLQNKLSRCRAKLQDTSAQIDSKKKDVDKLSSIISSYMQNRSLGPVEDIWNDYLSVRHQLTILEFAANTLSAEIDTVCEALGGDEGMQNPHTFKSTTFTIPTTCGYCKSSIWGLTKQGKTCKTCGLCVHAKCELKVPASCGGGGSGSSVRTPSRSTTGSIGSNFKRANSRASTFSSSTISSSTPSQGPATHIQADSSDDTHPSARVLYNFSPTSALEIAVKEDEIVHVIKNDDGSGWVRVATAKGAEGLVPASYIEVRSSPAQPTKARRPTQRTLGSGTYVRGIYAYKASGAGELNVTEGELFELSPGGQNYADGWWEGYDETGRKGIFPSSYVELV